jgi:hypothetical protein
VELPEMDTPFVEKLMLGDPLSFFLKHGLSIFVPQCNISSGNPEL